MSIHGELLKLAAARIVKANIEKQAGLFDFLKRDPVDKMYDMMEKNMKRQMELKRLQMAYQDLMGGGAVNVGNNNGNQKKDLNAWGGYKDPSGGYKNIPKRTAPSFSWNPMPSSIQGNNWSGMLDKIKGMYR